MQRVTIKFPTLAQLVNFHRTLLCPSYKIETEPLLLTCNCEEKQVTQAVTDFGGNVLLRYTGES